jgi:DNA modification methylase
VKPWLDVDGVTVFHGDCIEVMRQLPDNSVDAVVTDPPYGIGFMGKAWDAQFMAETTHRRRQYAGHPNTGSTGGYRSAAAEAGRYDLSSAGLMSFQLWFHDVAAEALRVLKPGGHLLAFGGTRTWHRLAVAIEDAGFDVRDSMAWLYGSGFPKSHDVSKAIDKAAGAERQVVGSTITGAAYTRAERRNADAGFESGQVVRDITAPATPAAEQWQGWGTALKPAHEPIVVARKPLIGTVAENVLRHGTGALNIDGCRITHGGDIANADGGGQGAGYEAHNKPSRIYGKGLGGIVAEPHTAGRWPANVILDESQAAELDKQSGSVKGGTWNTTQGARHFNNDGDPTNYATSKTDSTIGGASRFFYVAKAGKRERPNVDGIAHPTVKPMALMRYLVRLVTPPGGTVLEPFAGSGTTIEACVIEGFNCIAIEREADYLPLIEARLNRPIQAAL